MSFAKDDRNIRPVSGKIFRGGPEDLASGAAHCAAKIASALRHDFGDTHAAIKIVTGLTGANERAVKNWFDARNGPSGAFLISLCRHSEGVLESVLTQAGRPDILKVKELADLKATMRRMIIELEEFD